MNYNQADIILFLISRDFATSAYCDGAEVKRAIERQKANKAEVGTIILRSLDREPELLDKIRTSPIKNIPYSFTEDDLDDLSDVFAEYGTVKRVYLPTDRETGRMRGFGFVEMASEAEEDQAIESLDGAEWMGREHQRAALPLHILIVLLTSFLSLGCIIGGIIAIYQNAKTTTEMVLFGAHVTTGHVGVAFVALGLIIGYFTIRNVLKNQLDLAALPSDRDKIKRRDKNKGKRQRR